MLLAAVLLVAGTVAGIKLGRDAASDPGPAEVTISRSWSDCVVPPPTASLQCESGGKEFRCFLTRSRASAQVTWYRDGAHWSLWDGDTLVSGSCNSSTTVSVTVSNSVGSASDSWRNRSSGLWP